MIDDAIKTLLSDQRCAMISDDEFYYIKDICAKALAAAEAGDEDEAHRLIFLARDLLDEESSGKYSGSK